MGLLLVGWLPGTAWSQEVRGRLVTATGEPVPWALVRLVDAGGNEAATVISSASGAFHLRAAVEGTYRVQAERIGFAATVSDPLSLTSGRPSALLLTATDDPIELPPIDVGAESVCGLGRRAGPSLLAVWAEVRKALELLVGTEEGGAYDFVGEHYEYEVDRKGRPTDEKRAAESTERFRFSGSSGFHAIEPDMLARLGYRFLTPEGRIQYFAPDARTLLSESFQSRHCYSVKWDGDRLGLRFEPAALSGHKVDVDVALWLDGETGALQTIEFEYVSEGIPDYRLDGGYVEFEQLPEGAWIVCRWWLREPIYSRKASLRERRESPVGRPPRPPPRSAPPAPRVTR